MSHQKLFCLLIFITMNFVVSACGPGQFLGPTITPSPTFTLTPTTTPSPTPTATPTLTPSPTPVPPTILGRLMDVDTDGAIVDAKITLTKYEDEDCVNLGKSGETLSESEKKRLDDCVTPDFATTTTDTEGQYRFPSIDPGWYRMDIEWTLSKNPRRPLEFQNDFLILYLVSKDTPTVYSAWATGKISHFLGEEDMVIDFEYKNPGY